MVTLCFLNWEKKKKRSNSIFKVLKPPVNTYKNELSQKFCFLFPEPENDVGPKCVCVCVSGCVVYMCTYMYNIYRQYILYISIS